jgi:hypothetical protein
MQPRPIADTCGPVDPSRRLSKGHLLATSSYSSPAPGPDRQLADEVREQGVKNALTLLGSEQPR